MRSYSTHTLQIGGEVVVAHSGHEYLALVDVESYPAFVDKEVDHLDMMAHLYNQMKALTAVAWGAPGQSLQIRFIVTDQDHIAEHAASHCHTMASGWVRTSGRICFTSHDRLYDCAHHRTHDVLRHERLPKISRPHVLAVPPGLYAVQVFYHLSFPYGGGSQAAPAAQPAIHFTVILRHYPLPAPRVAPVRLSGMVPWAMERTTPPGDVITSHARVW